MAAAETSTADQRCEPPPALAVPRELHVGHLHHPSPAAGGGSALTGAYPSSPYHPGPRLKQCQAKAVEAASGCGGTTREPSHPRHGSAHVTRLLRLHQVQVPPAVAAQESEVAVPSRRVELSPAVCLVLRATLPAGFRPETAPPTTASPDHTPSSCLVGRQAARESRTGGRPTTGRSPHELHMLRAMARFDVFENSPGDFSAALPPHDASKAYRRLALHALHRRAVRPHVREPGRVHNAPLQPARTGWGARLMPMSETCSRQQPDTITVKQWRTVAT
ncbi:hypothetical protein VFPFJ_10071 [Purpureocillium lilacinum]|uniref:Uncharacterized protein n=1 Tax=Purpureocillium lilacinum TaxID=33203 RepID=A0A179GLP4_PURLI|nr:hypothetical protein VFPFJ_10071 [Purpureocillium lilacinum]OAQ78039.1 hypothetical protein VFPFJ_10071 [Purpureocillium lilacinum]